MTSVNLFEIYYKSWGISSKQGSLTVHSLYNMVILEVCLIDIS